MAERAWKYNPKTKRWEEVKGGSSVSTTTNSGSSDTNPRTGKGSAGKPGKEKPISSKDAPRNLQGAPQNTARGILGLEPVVPGPTPEELEAIRNGGNPSAGEGGRGGDPYARLLSILRGLGNSAAGNINTSMDALTQTLQAQANPFADYKAQQTQTTPELSQLLQSQGVSQDPLQQFAASINAQNQGQAAAFQNQANTMRDIYGANQAGSISDVAQQRSDLMAQLQGNLFGTGARLMGKQSPDRNAVLQMILQSMKAGK
jgi:hypothetical protein